MDFKDIQPMESVAELLSQGWIILGTSKTS